MGGPSEFWGRPFYQHGPGVKNRFTTVGNGSTHCSIARKGTPCRENPDISANADEWTPYAEFCTGNANTPFSVCGTFSSQQKPPGWFSIGGTGLINVALYRLLRTAPHRYCHDITGQGQTTVNNGLFPVTRAHDEAAGIGTPRMSALITRKF